MSYMWIYRIQTFPTHSWENKIKIDPYSDIYLKQRNKTHSLNVIWAMLKLTSLIYCWHQLACLIPRKARGIIAQLWVKIFSSRQGRAIKTLGCEVPETSFDKAIIYQKENVDEKISKENIDIIENNKQNHRIVSRGSSSESWKLPTFNFHFLKYPESKR